MEEFLALLMSTVAGLSFQTEEKPVQAKPDSYMVGIYEVTLHIGRIKAYHSYPEKRISIYIQTTVQATRAQQHIYDLSLPSK